MLRPAFSHALHDAARLPRLLAQPALRANIVRHASHLQIQTQSISPACRSLQSRAHSIFTPAARSWTRSRAFRTRPQSSSYSTNKPSPDVTPQLGSPAAKPGLKAKLKELFKKYGYLSVAIYLGLSALDLPLCFLAVRLAGPERIGRFEDQILSTLRPYTAPVWEFVEPVAGPVLHVVKEAFARLWRGAVSLAGFESSHNEAEPVTSGAASIWTQLALAYGIHKTLLIFIRVPLTAALTPKIAKSLQKRGWKFGSGGAS